jgi:hypothetical protein
MRALYFVELKLCLAFAAIAGMASAATPVPLPQAHAHNDYEHAHPLLDALSFGFCSVEADVHLVNGELLVAHDLSRAEPGRTLQALYLEPLRERVRANAGHVYPNGPEFTLLVDLKTDWQATYPVLRTVLQQYKEVLTRFPSGTKETNAITVILTGNRSKEMFAGEPIRLAALDGSLTDLDGGEPANLIPWISGNWRGTFHWNGLGAMPASEKDELKRIVTKAHHAGRRVRFWGSPDQSVFWRELLDAGVDLINTDDLAGLHAFLSNSGK